MFNLVFIRKYKKDVKGYIDRVYEPSAFERAFMNAFSIPFGSVPKKVVREEPKPSVEEDEVISVQKPMESVAMGIPVFWILNNDEITPPWGRIARMRVEE
jgi:hypothetical protein